MTQKLSTKTESLQPHKSSPKQLPKVTRGFGSARRPWWLRPWSTKTDSVSTQKSSTKHLPWVTPGFVRAHSPFWFRNSQQKLSHFWIRNSQRNHFHRWRLDSSLCPALVDLETVKENWATTISKIINKTDYKGDAWIRQGPQPLLTLK
jgi:hypothetical protein